jgi:predicted Zn-dependent peptidase
VTRKLLQIFLFSLLFLCFHLRIFAYDLSKVKVERLENGLTVMVLEDHAQPLVSTQVLYKVGGRNECTGATGLAHFVEHMAFRATQNFPDTQDAIYDVGGEWHGYTWIDQTTYFETVPIEHLDTVLRLQSDRMTNVVNRKEEVEAERGAVLTELHSYENDPATVLYDQVLAISFLEHPYRFNTIGWTSDVEKITHEDLVHFYKRFYSPSNAVLAIAGDVDTERVLSDVRKHFGSLNGIPVESLPRTVEPVQNGERRVNLIGAGKLNYYQITYRAPAATDPDYAPFLLLQAVLAGSNGVSFRQSGFGVRIPEGTRLAGIGRRITTFFASTAQPYVFNIAGNTDGKPQDLEEEIEKRIRELRDQGVSTEELNVARKGLLAELVFDIETTEDAAHQMAYFEGIGAFPVLQKLPALIQAVSQEEIRRVAQKYLGPERRTIGWYLGDAASSKESAQARSPGAWKGQEAATAMGTTNTASRPLVSKTNNGMILIVQRMDRSPAGFLRILIPSNNVETNADASGNEPVWRYTSLNWRFLKEDLGPTIGKAAEVIEDVRPRELSDPATVDDPETRLELELMRIVGAFPTNGERLKPVIVSVVGDVDPKKTSELLRKTFDDTPGTPRKQVLRITEKAKTVRLPGKAQSQFGYALLASPPNSAKAYALKALLYIMTHGYGGRLGKQLINDRGLIYYISNQYHSDGNASWISIRFGVNPDKLFETKSEFEKIMQDLLKHPPTQSELAEAKEHLVGRRITAYQSNEELSGFYVREWIEQGRLLTQMEFEKQVNAVTLDQIKSIIPEFLNGAQVIIDTNR